MKCDRFWFNTNCFVRQLLPKRFRKGLCVILARKTAVSFQRKREIVEENLRKGILQNTRNILPRFESKSTPLYGNVQPFKKRSKNFCFV